MDTTQLLTVLAQNPFFAGLQPELLTILAGAFELVKLQERQVVIAAGQTPESFFILLEGELKILRSDGKPVKKLKPNDFYGFKCLFDSVRAHETLVTEDAPCIIYQLHRSRLLQVLATAPQISVSLLPILAQHVRDATSAIEVAASRSVTPVEGNQALPTDPQLFKVKVFDSKPYQAKYFSEQNEAGGFHYDLEFVEESLTPETARRGIAAGAHAVCVFVHDHVTQEVAEILSRQGTELVALRCAGMDAVDIKACDQLGVSVVRVPSYSPNAIAEHAVALMMTLNRKLIWANSRVHNGDFSLDGLVGFDMKGKTVGVVGTGKIGACLVSILLGFGCRVICSDVYKNPALLANPAVRYVELDELLSESDIISLHAPLLPSTHHMINSSTIAKMKRGVMLINTSRGPLVDTSALIDGLKSGQIGSCGLDVVEGENDYFYSNHSTEIMANDQIARLLSFSNNVIMTSHQAFLTQEALREIATTTLQNIREYHRGKRMKSLTNSCNN